ncbi:hypothetical protein [Acinetobacter sp. YH12239]|uniref:hypothetical protein n=1 Tax=Acinetobacter sp. YH12239 TaxID=2601166 RepID=UPI0015D24599|nr:hypothetical protein [Acinetobacter sp. YH12239]
MTTYLSKTICFLLTLCISGCIATPKVMFLDTETTKTRTIKQEDKMIAIAQIKTIDSEQGLLFLGENYSYLITEGGEQLLQLIQNFPADERLLHNKPPIVFHIAQNTPSFSGELTFIHPSPTYTMEYNNLKKIQAKGFNETIVTKIGKSNRMAYPAMKIKFKGKIYQPTSSENIQHKLSKPYPISLEKTYIVQRKDSAARTLAAVILTPLALTFDIITLPIVIVGTPLVAVGILATQEDVIN